jgi:hypothetical protein
LQIFLEQVKVANSFGIKEVKGQDFEGAGSSDFFNRKRGFNGGSAVFANGFLADQADYAERTRMLGVQNSGENGS